MRHLSKAPRKPGLVSAILDAAPFREQACERAAQSLLGVGPPGLELSRAFCREYAAHEIPLR